MDYKYQKSWIGKMQMTTMTHASLLLLVLFLVLVTFTTLSSSLLNDQYSIIGKNDEEFLSEERVAEIFQEWKEKHGKVYKHVQEAEKRFQNFRKNLKYIVEKNSMRQSNSGHVVGLNKFADMSNEEFKKVYISKIKDGKRITDQRGEFNIALRKSKAASCEAPTSLDWRKHGVVTGVKDQGGCGSCWSFSTTGAIEGINALVTGDLISLSEQELVDCDSTNDGCEGGYMDYAFEWVISNGGIDTESDYPYTGIDGTCNITKEERKIVTIDGYKDVADEESALLCAVVQQPISVGIDGSAIDFQLYTGGIYDGECSDNPDDIDHAVLIVGYGSQGGEDYWIIKNSWGTYWGMEGYAYIRRNTKLKNGVCAINAMASYPTKESSSSPSPYPSPAVPPPPPVNPPPPPPPSPSPSDCGDYSYCPPDETCCCLLELCHFCFVQGCCDYENAVCCTGTDYCCPSDYPICDVDDGLCLRNFGDFVGVAAKKRTMAKHKFPWSKTHEVKKPYKPLLWKRNQLAAMR
ncbi:low-temperature-induced cysteine proteinase [Coffea arabica]|uniref:Low-temperature-induced cysteine proteinase n=1 Tax=Coffea arabica TaxID=13443 RepID=A0A6P6VR56_COFAR|nr:low-temperature-induced cysteine proteinase-like [Coffea arabica]